MIIKDQSDSFLQWCLPRLNYNWKGFKKVRKQVLKRISQRITNLNLSSFSQYKEYLISFPEEWDILDSLLYISISRFYRDKNVFESLERVIIPSLLERKKSGKKKMIRVWSAGSCSGEEPYTLNIIWVLRFKHLLENDVEMRVVASDKSSDLIKRAKKGIYQYGSLKHLPQEFITNAFNTRNDHYTIRRKFRQNIIFLEQDIRKFQPDGKFDIVMCRNLIFTYFDHELQEKLADILFSKLYKHGYLIIGAHEIINFTNRFIQTNKCIYKKSAID
ncbi:CheR family methyltransferase [Bacteroidota bacterium]